jgi:hypothetical protein
MCGYLHQMTLHQPRILQVVIMLMRPWVDMHDQCRRSDRVR